MYKLVENWCQKGTSKVYLFLHTMMWSLKAAIIITKPHIINQLSHSPIIFAKFVIRKIIKPRQGEIYKEI